MSTWHYMKSGVQTGPVPTEELSALIASGAVPGETLVWRQGLAGWVPANTLPEFAGAPKPAAAAAPAAPAKGGNRTLIIVLCVLGGILLLIGGCVTTCAYYATKKAKEYSRQAEKNPAFASLSLIAALDPEVEIVAKDEASGKITVRNKKTGETVTINTTDYTADNIGKALQKFSQSAQAAANQANSVRVTGTTQIGSANSLSQPNAAISPAKAAALAANVKKLPDYLVSYPGATTVNASTQDVGGLTSATYVGQTSDKVDDVIAFYEKKLTAAGFTIAGKTSDSNDHGQTAVLSAIAPGPQRNVTLSVEAQEGGQTQININFVQLPN